MNYRIFFTAWGVGGVFGPILAGKIADASGNYNAGLHHLGLADDLCRYPDLLHKGPCKSNDRRIFTADPCRETADGRLMIILIFPESPLMGAFLGLR